MQRKSYLAAVAIVAILAGALSARADNGGGGGGGESVAPGNFFAQNTNDVGPLEAERRRREYEQRVADSVNNQGRVPPTVARPAQTATTPAPAKTGTKQVRPGRPPAIPDDEADSTERLAGGHTLFTRPKTDRLWEAWAPEPGEGDPPKGWTQRLRLVNGETIYSGYGNYVVVISPSGRKETRFIR